MTFNAQNFLDQHGGDPLKALTALEIQRAEAQEGRDSEGQSAARARRERDEARSRTRELESELTAYHEHGSASEVATNMEVLDTLRDSITAAGITSGDIPAQVAARLKRAEKADVLERESAYQKAATDLKFDGAKLARVLRDEQGVPELRKVKVKVNMNGTETEVERDVWGIPARDASGKETGFTALAEHPDVKGFESALRVAGEPATAVTLGNSQPVIATAGASAAPPAGATFKLEGGLNTGRI